MKILIARLFPYEINIKSYNVQEIGLAKALIKKGHQCDIVFYTKGKERKEKIEIDNEKYITVFWINGINFLKNGLYGNKIVKLAKSYDIVQSSEYDQIYNLKLMKKLKNKLLIYHGPYYSEFNNGYNLKCKIFDKIFLNKKYKKVKFITKSNLATNFLLDKGFTDVTTVGVGLDNGRVENTSKKMSSNLINKLKDEEKYLLYIGKIEERRNIFFLINILKNLIINNPNIKLIMIGKGEKDYVEKVMQYAKANKVYENIIYISEVKQEEIGSLYKRCDVFLLPTSYEIFGMVLLEAMYFGIPTITTLNGGSSTLIKNEENGFIVQLNNEEKWINIIKELLESQERKEKILNNSRNTIKNNYLWDNLVDEFLKAYSRCEEKDG